MGAVILLNINLKRQSGLWASTPEVLPLGSHRSMPELSACGYFSCQALLSIRHSFSELFADKSEQNSEHSLFKNGMNYSKSALERDVKRCVKVHLINEEWTNLTVFICKCWVRQRLASTSHVRCQF